MGLESGLELKRIGKRRAEQKHKELMAAVRAHLLRWPLPIQAKSSPPTMCAPS